MYQGFMSRVCSWSQISSLRNGYFPLGDTLECILTALSNTIKILINSYYPPNRLDKEYPHIKAGLLKIIAFIAVLLIGTAALGAEDWPQYKGDSRHSGNVVNRDVTLPLALAGVAPLTDAVLTSPVVSNGRVYVVDASGVAFCFDAASLRLRWKVATAGGKRNCNNVSSPAVIDGYLHFGTMADVYYVLDAENGKVVRRIDCGEPIFSTPVVGKDRVYFATLGSRVYALQPDGEVVWTWDFVRERFGFDGDRWSGAAWAQYLKNRVEPVQQGRLAKGRVITKDMFLCTRDIALDGNVVVMSAGGTVIWLEDAGEKAQVRRADYMLMVNLGLSIGEDGTIYRQGHSTDNGGHVEILPPLGNDVQGANHVDLLELFDELEKARRAAKGQNFIPGRKCNTVNGTHCSTFGGLLSFSSVSVRGQDVFRCRPEQGFGLCRHSLEQKPPYAYTGCYPSITPPILLHDKAVYGGLDGALYVVPLEQGEVWSFKTPFGKAISAPAAVSDGHIYFGCEDGYLYALGHKGNTPPPTKDLELWKVRSPLKGPFADARYDRFTSFANWGNTNFDDQKITPPFKLNWIRRFEGSTKQFSTFGGGRMYTHTAEGQIFAVEQETGRLLWRRYFPGVHICYTSPLYHKERVLVPQAGLDQGRLRCLNAATGELLWEAPISGSPSWARQMPPVVYKNLAIYMFSTGCFGPEVPETEKVRWFFGSFRVDNFPKSYRPLVRAYDLDSGKEVWTVDFSNYGSGGDEAGLCLMDDKLYYSSYFGRKPELRGEAGPNGITAALDPQTGKIIWVTTENSLHGGCTISGENGRLYLGGYNPQAGTNNRHVWCLDARDGSLIWRSERLLRSTHVITIGPKFLFVHAQKYYGYLLDKQTGKIITNLTEGYRCTRFALNGNYLLGPNMDVIDVSDPDAIKLVSTGPRLDIFECISACASNGRLFYTGHSGTIQASLVSSEAAP